MFSLAEFAERLRRERKARGLNQAQFGSLGGIGLQTQSRYEKAETTPSAEYIAQLAAADVDVALLLIGRPSSDNLTIEEARLMRNFRSIPPPLRDALSLYADSMREYFERGGTNGQAQHQGSTIHDPRPEYRGKDD